MVTNLLVEYSMRLGKQTEHLKLVLYNRSSDIYHQAVMFKTKINLLKSEEISCSLTIFTSINAQ